MPGMEQEEPFDIEIAWSALQHAIAMMLGAFGGAAAIAASLILPRATRIQILQWLGPIEALARRLLLIEAMSLPAPNQPAPFIPRGKLANAYADKSIADLPDETETWRVRFNIGIASAPTKMEKVGVTPAAVSHPIQFNALALARRMEAVRRLFEQRALYAQRLAVRIHRAPARARKAFAPYRHRATAVQTLLSRTQQEANLALARLNTS
jgi:hypothetical protein